MRAIVDLIREVFVEEVKTLSSMLRERLLSGFRDMAEEAENKANEVWREWMSEPGGEIYEDPGSTAEMARGAGQELYDVLTALEQATRNLLAAGLYHLFEQHEKLYIRHLEGRGIHRVTFNKTLRGWRKVDELRLVANVAKHADEGSAKALKARRPDMFMNPVIRKLGVEIAGDPTSPMSGEGLYVTEDDLIAYERAIQDMWSHVAEIHEEGVHGRPARRQP